MARGSRDVNGDSSCKVYCLVNTRHDHRYTAVEEAEIRSNLGGELEIGMNGARNVPALARCKTQVSLHSSILERLPVEIRASEWPCQQPSLCLQPDLLLVTTYSRELSITCDCYQ